MSMTLFSASLFAVDFFSSELMGRGLGETQNRYHDEMRKPGLRATVSDTTAVKKGSALFLYKEDKGTQNSGQKTRGRSGKLIRPYTAHMVHTSHTTPNRVR